MILWFLAFVKNHGRNDKMNTKSQKLSLLLSLAAIAALTANVTLADDLNPPSYRFDPLSVHAHWQNIDGTANLTLTDYHFEDDMDPSTTLSPLVPIDYIVPSDAGEYKFHLPNWIDEMPIKHMRLQLTWTGNSAPPIEILLNGVEGTSPVPGTIVSTSPVTPTPAGASYQFYDIEFKPNPDFERWSVFLPEQAFLVQAVADTVSTVPEPATVTLLLFGSLVLLPKKKSHCV